MTRRVQGLDDNKKGEVNHDKEFVVINVDKTGIDNDDKEEGGSHNDKEDVGNDDKEGAVINVDKTGIDNDDKEEGKVYDEKEGVGNTDDKEGTGSNDAKAGVGNDAKEGGGHGDSDFAVHNAMESVGNDCDEQGVGNNDKESAVINLDEEHVSNDDKVGGGLDDKKGEMTKEFVGNNDDKEGGDHDDEDSETAMKSMAAKLDEDRAHAVALVKRTHSVAFETLSAGGYTLKRPVDNEDDNTNIDTPKVYLEAVGDAHKGIVFAFGDVYQVKITKQSIIWGFTCVEGRVCIHVLNFW